MCCSQTQLWFHGPTCSILSASCATAQHYCLHLRPHEVGTKGVWFGFSSAAARVSSCAFLGQSTALGWFTGGLENMFLEPLSKEVSAFLVALACSEGVRHSCVSLWGCVVCICPS